MLWSKRHQCRVSDDNGEERGGFLGLATMQ